MNIPYIRCGSCGKKFPTLEEVRRHFRTCPRRKTKTKKKTNG